MVAGRPQEYDREKIARDMIEWAKQPDSININKFVAHNDIAPTTFFRWLDEDPKFRESYEKVKSFLAYRREELLNSNKLHVKAYHLNATTYDAFAREGIRAEVVHEIKAKSEAIQEVSQDIHDKFDAVMNQLDSGISERKIAKSKSKIE